MEKQKEVPFTPDELRHFRWLFPNGFFTKIVRVITNAILRSPRLTEFVKEIVKETLAEQAVTVKPKANRPTKKSTTAGASSAPEKEVTGRPRSSGEVVSLSEIAAAEDDGHEETDKERHERLVQSFMPKT